MNIAGRKTLQYLSTHSAFTFDELHDATQLLCEELKMNEYRATSIVIHLVQARPPCIHNAVCNYVKLVDEINNEQHPKSRSRVA